MRVSQEYHDALIKTRDEAQAEADQAREEIEHQVAAIETLQRELDDARSDLAAANADRQPSDLADDIVEVFSKALTEWLTFYDFSTTVGEGLGDYLRPFLLTDLHFVLRHTGKDVDEVLVNWGVGEEEWDVTPLGGLQSLADTVERLATLVEAPVSEVDQS